MPDLEARQRISALETGVGTLSAQITEIGNRLAMIGLLIPGGEVILPPIIDFYPPIDMRLGNGLQPGFGFSGLRLAYPPVTYNNESWNLVGVENDVIKVGIRASDGTLVVHSALDVQNNFITSVADAVNPKDAVNLDTLLDHIGTVLNYWLQADDVMDMGTLGGTDSSTELIDSTPLTLTTIYFKSSVADTPTPLTLKAGSLIALHINAEVDATSGHNPCTLTAQLWYMDADGSSNPVQIGANSDATDALTTDKTEYNLHMHVPSDTTVPAGKRLWVKFIATTTGAQQDPTVQIYFGTTLEHLTFGAAAAASVGGGYDEGARVWHDAEVVSTSGVTLKIPFNSELYDTDTIHSTTVNNTRLTCKTAGKYIIGGHFFIGPSAGGARRATNILLNNTTVITYDEKWGASASVFPGMILSTVRNLAVDDYIELQFYQDSGGDINIQTVTEYSPIFYMQRIG